MYYFTRKEDGKEKRLNIFCTFKCIDKNNIVTYTKPFNFFNTLIKESDSCGNFYYFIEFIEGVNIKKYEIEENFYKNIYDFVNAGNEENVKNLFTVI